MLNFWENGLSGWIVSVVTLLIGGGAIWRVTRRKSRQSNITAGGDVAGGSITVGERGRRSEHGSSTDISYSEQSDIKAKGDVAGGNINKPGR